MNTDFLNRAAVLTESATPFVTVTLIASEGSVPSDVGSKMIVTHQGLDHGTVGGGRVETAALRHAAEMLASSGLTSESSEDGGKADLVVWNLNRDLGMTCGGRVTFFFERVDVTSWPIVVFGAGHVSQALCRLLLTLPCHVTCVDPRREWLDRLPTQINQHCLDEPATLVPKLRRNSYIVCMTRGHATDLPILRAIADLPHRFPFVGVIGSKTKAGALRRELGTSPTNDSPLAFHCPVGLPIGRNHPGEIAVSIAGQLLQVRDEVGDAIKAKTIP